MEKFYRMGRKSLDKSLTLFLELKESVHNGVETFAPAKFGSAPLERSNFAKS